MTVDENRALRIDPSELALIELSSCWCAPNRKASRRSRISVKGYALFEQGVAFLDRHVWTLLLEGVPGRRANLRGSILVSRRWFVAKV